MLLPIPLLVTAVLGLLSLFVLLASLGLFYRAWRSYHRLRSRRVVPSVRAVQTGPESPVAVLDEGETQGDPLDARAALGDRSVWVPLVLGLALFLFTFFGRHLVQLGFRHGANEPRQLSGIARDIDGPEGTRIHVEMFGQPDAPTLIFTHGWGTSNSEWYYAKSQLSQHFRLIFWDIPGLGASRGPGSRDFKLETMAHELAAVVPLAGGKPVVLVGHSIGGMINLTYCRLFPEQVGHQVAGIVQVDTSYTNPVTTTKDASLNEALQKPVAEPLLQSFTVLSPLVRAMNWLSYQNGTSHIMNAQSAFAGSETWGQVDLVSRYGYQSSPEVVARGTLGMFHWDAKPELARISVPVLILVGQQDTTTLPSASVFMQHGMPRATLQSVSPSAHYGLLEQNESYNAAIARFAAACLPSTKS